MYRPWVMHVLNASTRAEPVALDIKQPHHRCLVGQGGGAIEPAGQEKAALAMRPADRPNGCREPARHRQRA